MKNKIVGAILLSVAGFVAALGFVRLSLITLFATGLLMVSCSRQSSSGPPVFQMRLVQDSASADTEPMTIVHSLTDTASTNGETLNVSKKVLLDQSAVDSATVQTQGLSQAPMIEVVLTKKGEKVLADITRKSVGKRLAIVVDGKLLVAPRIEAEIPGGRALITGAFSVREASELAGKINDGVKR
jgi:preprotein translocase subunit SecD